MHSDSGWGFLNQDHGVTMENSVNTKSIEQWIESFDQETREQRRVAAIDFFKARAADYAQNFLSFRGVEWTVVYQLLAGFALLGAAFTQVPDGIKHLCWARAGFTGLASTMFFAWLFLAWQLQRRLHWIRKMQNAYFDSVRRSLLEIPIPSVTDDASPKFVRWYAFAVQLCVAVATYISITVYILSS